MRSIRFQLMAFITVLLLALLLLLNIYPIISSRDRVFEEKKTYLKSQVSVVSSSLASLERRDQDSIQDVLDLLDIYGFSRVAVTDGDGTVLYDSLGKTGVQTDIGDIFTALTGKTVFKSEFSDNAFKSCCTMPIYGQGGTLGAVYILEHDSERAEIILSIQSRIQIISLIIAFVAIAMTALFSRLLLRRIQELVASMRIVAGGKYDYRLVTSGHDEITELGKEFNLLTERLETNEKQRRRFVSDASHELKTPVASIRLLADSITQCENINSDTVIEFVADIAHEAERLQHTTEKLLELSRMDDGMSIVPEPVDVKQTALDAADILRPLANEKRVNIVCRLDEGCVVMATTDDMYNIIFNLMENAVKYNVENGSVDVAVRKDGETVKITVEDTGIGIPESDRSSIFMRFYRVDKARSREAGGTGLGLSIVHDCVALHGGTIAVGPNRPHGSRFIVTFPAATEEQTGI